MDFQSLLKLALNTTIREGVPNLDNLTKWLRDVDSKYQSGNKWEGKSFDYSHNTSFGFSNKPDAFMVNIPWGSLKSADSPKTGSSNATDYPAPLQKAFLDLIDEATKMKAKRVFIDLASLKPESNFFTEHKETVPPKSIRDALVDYVNGLPENTMPVIRYLIGDDNAQTRQKAWSGADATLFTNLFWQQDGNVMKPRIKHANARLYVGYYNPNFKLQDDGEEGPTGFIKNLKSIVSQNIPLLADQVKNFDAIPLVKYLLEHGQRSVSWNHGKVFAANGELLMTGGGNYWNAYASVERKNNDVNNKRIDHDIVDHQIQIRGDAAVSAHKWSDHFWQYLNKPISTDSNSICWGARFADENPFWFTRGGEKSENTFNAPTRVRVLKPDGSLPDDVLVSPFAHAFIVTDIDFPVLTASKLGDWTDSKYHVSYPAMIFDAIRDLLLNVFWQKNALENDSEGGLGFQMWALNKYLGDDNQSQKDMSLQKFNVNPTTWASRYTKNVAIANASTSVVICQQMLVQFLQARDETYTKSVVAPINKQFGLTNPKQIWDGFIWPFDLLIAIAQAIGKISQQGAGEIYPATANKRLGVWIVLTTKKRIDREDWEDQTSIPRLRNRIWRIMKGLPTRAGGIPDNKIDQAINDHLHFRRVENDDGTMFSHSKIVCVDNQLMYVGSDNAYPCYNKEHGVWIEKKDYVGNWLENFFDPYWQRCSPKNNEAQFWKDEVEYFRKTDLGFTRVEN